MLKRPWSAVHKVLIGIKMSVSTFLKSHYRQPSSIRHRFNIWNLVFRPIPSFIRYVNHKGFLNSTVLRRQPTEYMTYNISPESFFKDLLKWNVSHILLNKVAHVVCRLLSSIKWELLQVLIENSDSLMSICAYINAINTTEQTTTYLLDGMHHEMQYEMLKTDMSKNKRSRTSTYIWESTDLRNEIQAFIALALALTLVTNFVSMPESSRACLCKSCS